MRKKVYLQNSYGKTGDQEFILNGTKTTFGIFTKNFQERIFKNSDKLQKQLNYVSIIKQI